jgi:hypothetical protein
MAKEQPHYSIFPGPAQFSCCDETGFRAEMLFAIVVAG